MFLFPRIIYFGGYGEKTTDDARSRKDCFLVEEESWVIFFFRILICLRSSLAIPKIIYFFFVDTGFDLGLEQWGAHIWPHACQLEWTKDSCESALKTLDTVHRYKLVIFIFHKLLNILKKECNMSRIFVTSLKIFCSDSFCLQGQAPSARAAHASAQLGHRGYIIGGKAMVRAQHAYQESRGNKESQTAICKLTSSFF